MKKIFLLLIFISFLSLSQQRWEKGRLETEYIVDKIIVKFKNSQAVNSICQKYNLEIEKVLGVVQNLYLLKIKDGIGVENKIKSLKEENDIEYAEPNYILKFFATPNDTNFPQQWGLTKIKAPEAWDITVGDTSIVVAILDTGIDYTPAPMAGGNDRKHPDLDSNLWLNKGELIFNTINYNSIDDDKNGYVD
ncbi:MAG: hypothetical protein NZ891_02415, partial [bacterium]|nr:hypothetical protein [bacterium]MDW8163578.1 hypothetical protein [Candidatus Omnitrophota bacterium]